MIYLKQDPNSLTLREVNKEVTLLKSSVFFLLTIVVILSFLLFQAKHQVIVEIVEDTRIDTVENIVVFKATGLVEIDKVRDNNIPTYYNNPGALRPSSIKEINNLAINKVITTSGEFLVFPSPEVGFKALEILIKRVYWNSSIKEMMHRYAPPSQNNTEGYISSICKELKCSEHTLVKDVNLKQLSKLIAKKEGYKLNIKK